MNYKISLLFVLITSLLLSCTPENKESENEKPESSKKIGVLLVSHGSHSETWRNMLMSVEDSVSTQILANQNISGIKSAFMEYTEPSIASRLKEFDKEKYTDIIIVPVLLTISNHSFEDIPTICGLKNQAEEIDKLKQEGIEVYKANANVTITPLLDFPDILGKNLVSRVKKLSVNPSKEGVALIAYGSQNFDEEWTELMKKMAAEIKSELHIDQTEYAWCGHIVRYSTEPTTEAVNNILAKDKTAITIPVLIAVDEMFQMKIIGGGIKASKNPDKVKYIPDSILPDNNVEDWVIQVSNKYANDLLKGQ